MLRNFLPRTEFDSNYTFNYLTNYLFHGLVPSVFILLILLKWIKSYYYLIVNGAYKAVDYPADHLSGIDVL